MKQKCEKCGRVLRIKNLRKNKANGELWCNQCLKRHGENKFYIPGREKKKMGRFAISSGEEKVLFRTLTEGGMDAKRAWQRIRRDCKGLQTMKKIWGRKNKQTREERKEELKKNTEDNKKFLEGLK